MKISVQSVYDWYRSVIRNPKYRWWVILGTLLYFVSPFDIAPDFLPIVGQIDDVFVLTLLLTEVSGLVIEGFKARRRNIDANTAHSAEDVTSKATVDVDAVSVK
ncbi:MAG: YkvA family protein [Fischerella sp.]|nr:YkvA family protein [Fischerella sp.]